MFNISISFWMMGSAAIYIFLKLVETSKKKHNIKDQNVSFKVPQTVACKSHQSIPAEGPATRPSYFGQR